MVRQPFAFNPSGWFVSVKLNKVRGAIIVDSTPRRHGDFDDEVPMMIIRN